MKSKLFLSVLISASAFFVSCKDQENTNKESEQLTEGPDSAISRDSTTTYNSSKSTSENSKYVCFTFDDHKEKRIWIEFGDDNLAHKIKYEGQNDTISLQHTNEEHMEGGAHPTIIHYYDEMFDGKVNGSYKITHSGVWDYVAYTRGKDGKVFNYTIDHEANPYSDEPCF